MNRRELKRLQEEVIAIRDNIQPLQFGEDIADQFMRILNLVNDVRLACLEYDDSGDWWFPRKTEGTSNQLVVANRAPTQGDKPYAPMWYDRQSKTMWLYGIDGWVRD